MNDWKKSEAFLNHKQSFPYNLADNRSDCLNEPCFSSPKIINLIDGNLERNSQILLRKHLLNCLSCQKEFARLQKAKQLMDHHIPFPSLDDSIAESILNEVNELIKRVRKDYQNEKKSIFYKKGRLYLKSWITLLTSKDMILCYIASVLLGLTLKSIF